MNMFVFAFIVAILTIYFAPTLVAWNKRQGSGVFAVNFLLGWSIVGWAMAMVWALTPDRAHCPFDDHDGYTAAR